eukprot:12164191-Alexandrium_andersonii.AAC.1
MLQCIATHLALAGKVVRGPLARRSAAKKKSQRKGCRKVAKQTARRLQGSAEQVMVQRRWLRRRQGQARANSEGTGRISGGQLATK